MISVLVNALPARHGGGVTYLRQQLSALSRVAPNIECHTLLSPWSTASDLPGTVEVIHSSSVPSRFAYEQVRLPLRHADVLYCPLNFGPILSRVPVVLTLQNANYYGHGLRLQEAAPSRPIWKVKANHWAMIRADAVIAISDSLADEVIETMPSVRRKIHVIKSGAPEWPENSAAVPNLPPRYFVSVGSGAPHKRNEDVVAGWARFRRETGSPIALVLVGPYSREQIASHRALAGQDSHQLTHLGTISDRRQLAWIFEHASAMISMSLLEAFPMTPAEAGYFGCPLVLSDIPPHREVTRGDASFVPPRNIEALAGVLAGDLERFRPGSRAWTWPLTWDDNAEQLRDLLGWVAKRQRV